MLLHRSSQSALPPRERRRTFRVGRAVARTLCAIFALAGLAPLLLLFVARLPAVQRWAQEETKRLLDQQGIAARYDLRLRGFPPQLALERVLVRSSDGGAPVLRADLIAVRPRLFALLSGRLVVDQIEIDSPKVRLVIEDGKLANLAVRLPDKKSEGPIHLPFGSFAVTDGDVDLTIEGVRVVADAVDLDVTTEDDPARGSTLETELRVGSGTVRRVREVAGRAVQDDDAVCSLEARVRVEPQAILVRRLSLAGAVDLDHVKGPSPPCELPAGDRRAVALTLAHVRVDLPQKPATLPRVQGHVKARLPLALTQRLAAEPATEGWFSTDVDVAYDPARSLPDVKGTFEAGGVRVMQYAFARSFAMSFELRGGVVKAERATLGIADGVATLHDVEVRPLEKGIPVKAGVDVRDVSFNSLMHDLGVSKHPWVEWRIKEVHLPIATGTLVPLKIDGDFTAKTPEFLTYDGPIEQPGRQRMVRVENADIAAHLAIRPDSLEFRSPHVRSARSEVWGDNVLIGFSGQLEVTVPKAHIDFAEIGPLGPTHLAGVFDGSVHLFPTNADPKLDADGTVADFVLGDLPLGSVQAVRAHLDINPPTMLTLTGAKARKGKSEYEMPEARMGISKAGLTFDARIRADALDLGDFLGVFRLDDDPRFSEYRATLATDATLHAALGGPEDKCGTGYFAVRGGVHLTNAAAFGETFEEGDVDLDVRFADREAGLAGADVDIGSFSLTKVRRTTDKAVVGSVLGSATLARGGALHGSAVIEGVPLGRVQALAGLLPAGTALEGTASGIARLGGTLDAVKLSGDINLTPVRLRGVPLGASHVTLAYQEEPPRARPVRRTACQAPIYAPFDKEAYARDTSSQGTWQLDGDLFGGQVKLAHVTATQQKQMQVAGTIHLDKLDLGAAIAVATWKPAAEDAAAPADAAKPTGSVTGDVLIDSLRVGELGRARLSFLPRSLSLAQGGRTLSLKPTTSVLTMKNGVFEIEPLALELATPEGLSSSLTVRGRASRLDADPTLDIDAELAPIDLGLLVGMVPKLDRAEGRLAGSLHVGGRAADPELDGGLRVTASEIAVHGWPSVVSAVDLELKAGRQEITIARGSAKFAGGTISASGRLPIRNLELGEADVALVGRGLRLMPVDGVSAAFDANLRVTADLASARDHRKLPHVMGDVTLTDFDYSRPVNLSTEILEGRAQRTVVETYDPALDALMLDVTVRARAPLRIHNNLVETQLALETGSLAVSGTNQRFGLRGTLRALPGGRFRIPFTSSVFDVKSAQIQFNDPTRIAPHVDIQATTEYRRGGDALGGAVAAYGASAGSSSWRFNMHAQGDPSDLKVEFTSDPQLSQEDIMLLLSVGMTRAEIEQIRGGVAVASAGAALEALNMTGTGSRLKESINVVDDFRFGSAYSPRTGRSEPQITIGKQISKDVRAQVQTSVAEDRELRAAMQVRLGSKLSAQASYDNVNSQFSPQLGNVGFDLRWRLEFE